MPAQAMRQPSRREPPLQGPPRQAPLLLPRSQIHRELHAPARTDCLSPAVNRLVRALFWHSSLTSQVSREAGWMDAGQPSGLICEGHEFLLLGPCRCSCLVSASAASSQRGDRTWPRGRTLQRKSADRGGGRRRPRKGRARPRKIKMLTFLLPSQRKFKTAYTYGICHTEHYFEQKFSYKNI